MSSIFLFPASRFARHLSTKSKNCSKFPSLFCVVLSLSSSVSHVTMSLFNFRLVSQLWKDGAKIEIWWYFHFMKAYERNRMEHTYGIVIIRNLESVGSRRLLLYNVGRPIRSFWKLQHRAFDLKVAGISQVIAWLVAGEIRGWLCPWIIHQLVPVISFKAVFIEVFQARRFPLNYRKGIEGLFIAASNYFTASPATDNASWCGGGKWVATRSL